MVAGFIVSLNVAVTVVVVGTLLAPLTGETVVTEGAACAASGVQDRMQKVTSAINKFINTPPEKKSMIHMQVRCRKGI
jgi:hypothetical protein